MNGPDDDAGTPGERVARTCTAASAALSRFSEEWNRLPEEIRAKVVEDGGREHQAAARLVRTGILLGEAISVLQVHGLAEEWIAKARPYARFILSDPGEQERP